MVSDIISILEKKEFDHGDIVTLLKCDDEEACYLYRKAAKIKEKYIGNVVFLRGLIEYSNICGKNCLYCGVRRVNHLIERYTLNDEEAIEAALQAHRMKFGSIALQAGENVSKAFTDNIESLIRTIRKETNNELGITLSLGEQTGEVYQRWFEAGAHRYLLRIEASSIDLYKKVHPDDDMHDYNRRIECLKALKETGYQTGTGVMIGLPFQTINNLADDILFMRDFDIDMCGMGPFIEHSDTPLGGNGTDNLFLRERFGLTLRMIAVIRIIMKDINIVASTAMQAIDHAGREKAIICGANIVMPNLTPERYRPNYRIYEKKPGYMEIDNNNVSGLNLNLIPGTTIGLGTWGDPVHFIRRRALI
ncbi:MAG TPA: [FeFe] hydrogenase H-cluster radical SAM maturase HydE [Bacteroidales bacterium]|nr:[FeFe] hydrogenase H-cluster radical SAM maturase HydE [Bacteroidales bacterium]